jgi:hypothetical protein
MTITDEKTERVYKVLNSIHAQIAVLHKDFDGIKTRLGPIDMARSSTERTDTFGIKTRLTSIDTRLGLVHEDLERLSDQFARLKIIALDG